MIRCFNELLTICCVTNDNRHNLVTNVSAWFFWNTVNFVDFSVIHVSHGSVATYVRCCGMST